MEPGPPLALCRLEFLTTKCSVVLATYTQYPYPVPLISRFSIIQGFQTVPFPVALLATPATVRKSALLFIRIGACGVSALACGKTSPDSAGHIDIFRKIVCIESADPGYDWIFTRGILGLVTKFGGANSHMTIRCAELGLPAAIGVGEHTFDWLTKVPKILLDCAEKELKPA